MNNCTVNTIKVLASLSLRSNVLEAVAPLRVLSSKVGEVIKSTFFFPHVPLVSAFVHLFCLLIPSKKKKSLCNQKLCVCSRVLQDLWAHRETPDPRGKDFRDQRWVKNVKCWVKDGYVIITYNKVMISLCLWVCHIFHFSLRVTEDTRVPGETGDSPVWGSKVTRWIDPQLQNINLKPFLLLFLFYIYTPCFFCILCPYVHFM